MAWITAPARSDVRVNASAIFFFLPKPSRHVTFQVYVTLSNSSGCINSESTVYEIVRYFDAIPAHDTIIFQSSLDTYFICLFNVLVDMAHIQTVF